MKKLLLLFTFICLSIISNAQFVLTSNGFVSTKDSTINYHIIEFTGKNQSELYEAVCISLNRAYKYPNHTQSKVENKSIQISGVAPGAILGDKALGMNRYCDLHHTINIEFKDNKIRVTVISFSITNQLTGNEEIGLVGKNGLMSKFIFDKKGKLKNKRVKQEVEKFFNDFVKNNITECINNANNDW